MQAPALPIEGVFPPSSRHSHEDLVTAATLVSSAPAEREETPRAETAPSVPPPVAIPPSWTADLLAEDAAPALRREATRFAVGLGLAAVYGLAIGARTGGFSLVRHAIGVPTALLAAFGVGVPALYIFLALVDAPVAPGAMAAAATRATASAGLVLAGLAPAAALFVVTSERPGAAALAASVGLALGGAFGLGNVVSDLRKAIADARVTTRFTSDLAFGAFGLFAIVVALRVWASLLPVLGGAR